MDYQFSLAYLTVLGCPPPEMVYTAAMCGYDYVSLRPVYMGLPGEPNFELFHNRQLMQQTKRALADTGLKVHDMELFRIAEGKDVREYEGALAAGAELNAKSALASIWTDDLPRAAEQFALLAELAQGYGLNVDLEFVTWASVYDLQGAMAFLQAQSASNIGLMIDTLHFYRSRVTLEELAAVPREWIHFIHICDGPPEIPQRHDTEALIHTGRDARLYVGEGAIDIAAILNQLPAAVCSIELPHVERVREFGYAEHARRCLASAKEYFAQQQVVGKQ